jgi:hypothetical protein
VDQLHDNPNFRGFVEFLRAELDRVGPAQPDLCHDFFRRAVTIVDAEQLGGVMLERLAELFEEDRGADTRVRSRRAA